MIFSLLVLVVTTRSKKRRTASFVCVKIFKINQASVSSDFSDFRLLRNADLKRFLKHMKIHG